MHELAWWQAIILGLVEGATEYLPVSSTGHLAVTRALLGIGEQSESARAAIDAYVIAIQLGAILAVFVLYADRVRAMVAGIAGRSVEGRRLAVAVMAAFLPAAVVGFLAGDLVKENLFGIWPTVGAWFVGGLAILILVPRLPGGASSLEALTVQRALIIGLAQVLALWPGTSRSLVTILAGLAVGLTVLAAVEFSFLLGLVTLGAATLYETLRSGPEMVEQFGLAAPVLGLAAAFVSAVLAVRWLVAFLTNRPLTVFGWYRIGIAVVVAGLAATPVL